MNKKTQFCDFPVNQGLPISGRGKISLTHKLIEILRRGWFCLAQHYVCVVNTVDIVE